MLEFPVRPHRKSARLRHKFPNMEALTVCAHLQLDPTCHGLSTVFSYAIRSFIKEFQLQARITGNEPVQLALLVHGSNTTYVTGFPNDASWHFVCASLVANSGKWGIWVDGMVVGSGNSLNTSNFIGGDGLFMIGQDQEPYGGYNGDKALCGNVTQLYMWDRLLVDTEIQSMEKVCSPVPSGLFFKWNNSALEIETSLQTRRRNSPCKGRDFGGWYCALKFLHYNFHSSINVNTAKLWSVTAGWDGCKYFIHAVMLRPTLRIVHIPLHESWTQSPLFFSEERTYGSYRLGELKNYDSWWHLKIGSL